MSFIGVAVAIAGPNDVGVFERTGDAVGNPAVESVTFNTPYDAYQIRSVTDGSYLQIGIEDCCIAGDVWSTRTICRHNGLYRDVRGLGNGSTTNYTGVTTVYQSGSHDIDCITEIHYVKGVDIWGAGMSLQFKTNAGFNVTTTVVSPPVPLP